jgi:hypothetical protein
MMVRQRLSSFLGHAHVCREVGLDIYHPEQNIYISSKDHRYLVVLGDETRGTGSI